jgi:hypothetical protein
MTMKLTEIKRELRDGPYAWPGGYPKFFITYDGAALSFAAVREQFREVCWASLNHDDTGWLIEAVDINYEDAGLVCDHTGERIPSAYRED